MKHLKLTLIALLIAIGAQAQLPITGPTHFCVGVSGTLADATPGGTWSSSNLAIAVIGSSSGVVTGISAGPAMITYTVGSSFVTHAITIDATPGAISGPSAICVGTSATLTVGVIGGTWSSSTVGVITIAPTTGIITGVTAGVATITYSLPTGCATTRIITVNPVPATITGLTSVCLGATTTLSSATTGGLWSSTNPTIATISSSGGVVTGIGLGWAGISYTLPATGCFSVTTVNVVTAPALYTVTGGGSFCAGGTGFHVLLSGSSAGVSYQLFNGTTMVGTPIAGTGAPLDFGLLTLGGVYTVVATSSGGCMMAMTGSATITVNPLPTVYTVTGGGSYCAGGAGSLVGLTGSSSGVNYQLYMSGAPVGSAVAGTGGSISFGSITTAGTYTVVATNTTTTCTNNMVGSAVVSVLSLPTITASSSSACGGVVTLTGGGGVSYFWAPSTGLSCGTCGTSTTTPTSTIVYTLTGTDASGCSNTATVSVNGNIISGQITYTGGVSTDVFKVWLVQYNPTDSSILATDSTTTCMISGTTPYYEFTGAAAGSYMVKAKLNGTVAGSSGYIPTYGTSTPNWYSAATVTHASSANTMNITMVYGTVPSGPGFISGYVYAGAGKGTAGDYPEPNMLVYLKDAAGNVLTYTYTDAAGAYTFSGLGYGSYVIYPEEYDYYTVPSAVLTLSSSVTSMSGLYFKKGTTSHTITPLPMSCCGPIATKEFQAYPNPTSGELTIEWNSTTAGKVEIVLCDVTGRNVYSTAVDVTPATGKTRLNLQELKAGIYLINVKSNDLNYNGKVTIQK